MAEFVTRKEAQRRLWTVIVCAVLSVIALAVGLLNYKAISDEEKAEQAGSVASLRREIDTLQKSNQALRDAYRDFSWRIGWSRARFDTGSRAVDVNFGAGMSGITPSAI